jgi:peroxiredoxin
MRLRYLFSAIFFSFNLYAVGIEGQQAPSFGVDKWIQTKGKTSIDIEDYKGKVLYLYGFQSWCPGCHSHGFPTLQKLSKYYKNDKNVAFVAIQTVFEGFSTNTITAAEKIIKQYNLTMPVGHSGINNQRSTFMLNYKSGGTPWTVIIDKKGIVRFNNFHLTVDELKMMIDVLKKEV